MTHIPHGNTSPEKLAELRRRFIEHSKRHIAVLEAVVKELEEEEGYDTDR